MVFQGVFGDQTQPIFVGENKIMCVCFFGPSNRIKELIILSFSGWNFYIHRSKVLTCSWKWGPRSKRSIFFCISGYRISVLLPVFFLVLVSFHFSSNFGLSIALSFSRRLTFLVELKFHHFLQSVWILWNSVSLFLWKI